jgi:hypothetical protein
VTERRPTARQLFEELAAEHRRRPGAGRRRMFGRDGLSVHGMFFAFLNGDRLVLKLPPVLAAALLAAGDALPAVALSPSMRTWVMVLPPAGVVDDRDWRALVAEARAYAGAAYAPPNEGRDPW